MTDTLDITDWKQHGEALKTEINNAVGSTQSLIMTPLPSVIVMTPAQYDDLQDDPEMMGAYQSDVHIYKTEHNVMEVVIK